MKHQKLVTILAITLIIVAGLGIRLYRADEHILFYQDQSDDLLATQAIVSSVQEGKWTSLPLQGEPGAASGMVRHGAFFLYLLTFMAWSADFDPYGTTLWFVALSTLSIWLMYLIGSRLWDTTTGILAAVLWAISYESVVFSRAIWTPSLVPIFALISLFGIVQITRGKRKYWPLAVVAAIAASQLYVPGYVFLLYIVMLCIFWRMPAPKTLVTWMLTIVPGVFLLVPTVISEYDSGFQTFWGIVNALRLILASEQTVFFHPTGFVTSLGTFFLSVFVPTETVYYGNIDNNFYRIIIGASITGFILGNIPTIRQSYGRISRWRFFPKPASFPTRLFFLWIVIFAPTPFIAKWFYPYEELDRILLWGMPFALLICARALFYLIRSRAWRPIGILLLMVILGANLFVTREVIWENKFARFNYGDKLVLLRHVAADVGDEPYNLVVLIDAEQYSFAGSLYLLSYNGWALPERFNGLQEIPSWAHTYKLGGRDVDARFTITNMEEVISLHPGDQIARAGNLTLYKQQY
jgi:hypothetical protein